MGTGATVGSDPMIVTGLALVVTGFYFGGLFGTALAVIGLMTMERGME